MTPSRPLHEVTEGVELQGNPYPITVHFRIAP